MHLTNLMIIIIIMTLFNEDTQLNIANLPRGPLQTNLQYLQSTNTFQSLSQRNKPMGPIYSLKTKPKIGHINTLPHISFYSVVVVFINKWFKCSANGNISNI